MSGFGSGGGAVSSAMPPVGVVPLGTRATTLLLASAGPLAPGARGGTEPGEHMHAAAGPVAVEPGGGAEGSGGGAGEETAASGLGDQAPSADGRGRTPGGVRGRGEAGSEAAAGPPCGADATGARTTAGGWPGGEAGEGALAGRRPGGEAGGGASAGGRGRGQAGGPGQAEDVPHVLYVRFHPTPAEDVYQGLLALLGELTPVVEALPPDAALADVRGALRYFGRDAAGLAEIVRVRALARYGVDCTIGVAANPMLARMAAQEAREAQATQVTQATQEAQEVQGAQGADAPGPGGGRSRRPAGSVRTVPGDPDGVAAFLARKPPTALPGVGPATARTLSAYGLDSAARIAAAPLSTLQRILGAATARRVHAWAHGIDPMPVTPNAPARAMGAEHRFRHDELDPVRRRRALLTLADGLGGRLRTSGQVAAAISLTVRYADRSTTTRSRTLAEPTAHTPALTAAAYALHDALGLQRARVRSVALRVEGLMDAELAPHQLTFDPADEKSRRLEAAADRARARFGASAARPAGFLDVA